VQTLLTLGKVYGNSGIRRRCGQKNVWYCVADHGMGMPLLAMVFSPHAPDAQTVRLSIFFHYFKRLERFQNLEPVHYVMALLSGDGVLQYACRRAEIPSHDVGPGEKGMRFQSLSEVRVLDRPSSGSRHAWHGSRYGGRSVDHGSTAELWRAT